MENHSHILEKIALNISNKIDTENISIYGKKFKKKTFKIR